jgi:hypothetical protein
MAGNAPFSVMLFDIGNRSARLKVILGILIMVNKRCKRIASTADALR